MSTPIYAKSEYVDAIPISLSREVVAYTDGEGNYHSQKTDDYTTPVRAYDGKSITEQNLTSLLSTFLGNELTGFVISKDSTSLMFMLNGYYFRITDSSILNSKPLYVSLSFNDPSANEYRYLIGDSVEDDAAAVPEYRGLSFTTNEPSSGIYLQLLDASGNVPIESYYKFRARDIKDIDAGTI